MNRMNPEYQRAVSDFVSREVHYCVSHLVSELAQNESYMDELMEVCAQDDWLEPATDKVSGLERSQVVEWLESISIDCQDDESIETLRDALTVNLEDGTIDPQEFCDIERLDPYTRGAYEHWIVSDWLADKLAERGEMVLKDFLGLTIWGRTTTGQAIALDAVICDIWDSING